MEQNLGLRKIEKENYFGEENNDSALQAPLEQCFTFLDIRSKLLMRLVESCDIPLRHFYPYRGGTLLIW